MKRFISLLFLLAAASAVHAQFHTTPVVYLNLTGAEVVGTAWNTNGPITAQPYQIPQASKNEILRRVQEDFSIFDINITLDSNEFLQVPLNRRMEVIITPTAWNAKGGGIAYVGSFNWADYTPAWVFTSRLSNNIHFIAEATSHEIGHVFGLLHQSLYDENCEKISEYFEGQGGGVPTSWDPIMGSSYFAQISTWYTGTSAEGCEFIQNDIEQMMTQSLLNLLPDDYSNDYETAHDIPATAGEFGLRGVINNAMDEDVFKIVLNKTTRLKLDALPFRLGTDPKGANVHLDLRISSNNGEVVKSYLSLEKISASLDTTVPAGIYFITVSGAENRYLSRDFSIGSYSLAGIINYALPITKLSINGQVNNNIHTVNWKFEADEAIESISLQYSSDGSNFNELVNLPATARLYAWNPQSMPVVYYRVKVNTVNRENAVYSKIILLESNFENNIFLTQDIQSKIVNLRVQTPANYELFCSSGSLLRKGNLAKGEHHLDFRNLSRNVLILKVYTKGEIKVHKLIL